MMDKVRLLLTNKTGGYTLFGDPPRSRFEGVFFRRNDEMYKTIESFQYDEPAKKVTNKLCCIERERGRVTERIVMPHGKDAILIDLSAPLESTIVLDVKRSYDNRNWGREYTLDSKRGCLVFSFKKSNDSRDDNRSFHEEYECHVAVCANPLEYIPIKQWEEHFYSLDNARKSYPDKRWVFVGAKLRASRMAVGFGLTKKEAVQTARQVLVRASKIMKEEEQRVSKLAGNKRFRHHETDIARHCCVHALDSLTVERRLYAGLPWFFQFWARDEIISTRGLLIAGKQDLAKDILMTQLDRLQDGNLSTHPTAQLRAADAPGWLFVRLEELVRFEKHNRARLFTAAERKHIQNKLLDYLDTVQRFNLDDGLVRNGPQETWMDTAWDNDTRQGKRIEIQALVLASCRFYTLLTGRQHTLEKGLKQLAKQHFHKRSRIYDGVDDPTARPNAFIAAYVYPELFTKKEWTAFIASLLPKLWLSWGGLASIDKKSELFAPSYTGENNRSYHRGDSWFWINNLAAIVMHRMDKKKFERHINKILHASVHELVHMGASGFSAEISSAEQLRSEGCLAQTWSSALLLELLDERYG